MHPARASHQKTTHSSKMMAQSPSHSKHSHPQSSAIQTMKELLTCLFGAEQFQMYVFSWHFMIESDHKSLQQISVKNLVDAPVSLQRMLFWLQDCDFTIKHCPGEEMVVADTLLRYSPEDTPEILLDFSVNHVHINAEKKWDYQLTINDDPLLSALADMIIAVWPDDIKNIPKALWLCHGQCDSLTIEDGYPMWRNNHCSPRGQEEGLGTDPSGALRHIEVPVLTSNNKSKHAPLVIDNNLRNQSNHWSQDHHLNYPGNN